MAKWLSVDPCPVAVTMILILQTILETKSSNHNNYMDQQCIGQFNICTVNLTTINA